MIKIGDYIRVMLFALMFDTLASFFSAYSLPCASMLAAAAAIFIEGYSVRENAQRKKSGADIMIDIAQATAKAAATHCGLGNLAASVSDIIDEKL